MIPPIGVSLVLKVDDRFLHNSSILVGCLRGTGPVKAQGLSGMLMKRKIGLFKETMNELDLDVKIKLVGSAENRADALTRVPVS